MLPRIATFLLFLSLLSIFLGEIAVPGVSSAHSNNHAVLLQTETHNVREIPIVTADVVFERNSGKLYASVPSKAGAMGNRIAKIRNGEGVHLFD